VEADAVLADVDAALYEDLALLRAPVVLDKVIPFGDRREQLVKVRIALVARDHKARGGSVVLAEVEVEQVVLALRVLIPRRVIAVLYLVPVYLGATIAVDGHTDDARGGAARARAGVGDDDGWELLLVRGLGLELGRRQDERRHRRRRVHKLAEVAGGGRGRQDARQGGGACAWRRARPFFASALGFEPRVLTMTSLDVPLLAGGRS
jgi:hypothetical protein